MSKEYIKIAFLFYGLFMGSSMFAQDAYQRFMTTDDRILVNMGNIPTQDGGFYMLNLSIDLDVPSAVNLFQLSRNNPKGNLIWTREYKLKDETLVINFKSIDFTTIANDTIIISGITLDQGFLEDEKFILKVEPRNGVPVWSGLISDMEDQLLPVTIPAVLDGYNGNFNYYNSHGNRTGDTLAIQRVQWDTLNNIVQQIAYLPLRNDGLEGFGGLLDAVSSIDSNDVISFISESSSTRSGIMSIDTAGNVLMANEYSISPDSIGPHVMQTVAIHGTPDTGLVMAGIVVDLLTSGLSNYIIRSDSSGLIEWSKKIDASDIGFITQVNDVIYTNNDEVVVSGKYFNIVTLTVGDFMIFLDEFGNVLRQWDYVSDNSLFILSTPQGNIQFSQGEMGNMIDGGILYTTTGFDANTGQLSPNIIKTDPLGMAICQDTLDVQLVSDFEFLVDTLIMITDNYILADTLLVSDEMYSNFNVPVLQLLDTFFCPQDPIMVTLDATLPGASTYEWSTGEMTPSILVTEEGEYSVTVTINEKICYALCDTSNISQRDFPEASISPNLSGLCELGTINLVAGSSTDIVSAGWSTGDSTIIITIDGPGTYTVGITDSCDNQDEASITISESQFDTSVMPGISGGAISCQDGSAFQILQVNPNSQIDITSVLWSTGETTESITAEESGTYSVTVTNACGNTGAAEATVQDLGADEDFGVSVQSLNIICTGQMVTLQLRANVTSNQGTTILWSTGATTNIISVSAPGTYTVQVTNFCGDVVENEITVSAADLMLEPPTVTIVDVRDTCEINLTAIITGNNSIGIESILWSDGSEETEITVTQSGLYSVTVTDVCGNSGSAELSVEPNALAFPNVFFPEGTNNDNRQFGAFVRCPDAFDGTNFKLDIFNRFENRVFESTNINNRWNGTFKGSLAPRDVYMYQWSYDSMSGEVIYGEGTITLYR